MEEKLYNLHIKVGLYCGKQNTCGTKIAFPTEEGAIKAANSHNKWEGRNHDVEHYPCGFCNKWHVGRTMTEEELEKIVRLYDANGNMPPS